MKLRSGAAPRTAVRTSSVVREIKIRTVGEYPLGNLSNLLGRFALTENYFRKAEPQVAMMIDSREGDVFVGQARHLVGRFVDIDAPGSHLLEQLLDSLPVRSSDCSMGVLARLTR